MSRARASIAIKTVTLVLALKYPRLKGIIVSRLCLQGAATAWCPESGSERLCRFIGFIFQKLKAFINYGIPTVRDFGFCMTNTCAQNKNWLPISHMNKFSYQLPGRVHCLDQYSGAASTVHQKWWSHQSKSLPSSNWPRHSLPGPSLKTLARTRSMLGARWRFWSAVQGGLIVIWDTAGTRNWHKLRRYALGNHQSIFAWIS